VHRRHHQYSDTQLDPHSPHQHGWGVLGMLRGAWHAHLGWLFKPEPPDLDHYIKDLRQSRMLCMVSALFLVWVAAGLLIPALLGGLLTGTWEGVWSGLAWDGMGEGWHNTHHAFPTSARHGLRWWQIDMSYYVIKALALVGLAWNVKVPTKQAQTAHRA
jgi:stearoyl-CoA desaturase (delta-9 desaturase)